MAAHRIYTTVHAHHRRRLVTSPPVAHRPADPARDPRARLLLRRQVRDGRRPDRVVRQGVLSQPAAPLRQEPASRHVQGTLRGPPRAVRGTGRRDALGLVAASPRHPHRPG